MHLKRTNLCDRAGFSVCYLIELHDGVLPVRRVLEPQVVRLDGKPGKLAPMEITWSLEDADKHGYDHFYLKEIHEQPKSTDAELQHYL